MVDMVEGMEEDTGADILKYMSTLTADDNFVIFASYTQVACLDFASLYSVVSCFLSIKKQTKPMNY